MKDKRSGSDDNQMNIYIPLSKNDLIEYLRLYNITPNIIQYPDLKYIRNINEIVGIGKPLIILYKFNKNYGHWTLILKLNSNTLEFFDSFGRIIDDNIIGNMRKIDGQNDKYLEKLLFKSNYDIHYNNYRFQNKMINNIPTSTCGRHVIYRILNMDMDIDQYKRHLDYLKKKYRFKNYDELISEIIN